MFRYTATRWHLTGGIIHFQGPDGSLSPDPDLDPAEPGDGESLAHEGARFRLVGVDDAGVDDVAPGRLANWLA